MSTSSVPNIVVLDGYTLNPGDLDWGALEQLGACAVHDRTPRELIVERAGEASIVLTNKTVLDRAVIEKLPALRYIGVLATGTNVVDLVAAKEHGVTVTNVPAYGTESVAQATLGLMLELCNHTGLHARSVADGKWSRSLDFCYWERPIVELAGMTLGIVGYGAIGRGVAQRARAFGMEIVVYTPRPGGSNSLPASSWKSTPEELFAEADMVSLHCPLTADNARFVDAALLGRMKAGGYLVNTARGGLLDEAAVAAALQSGHLAGVAVDVLSVEPPSLNNPLLSAPRCIVTPHVAWASRRARGRLLEVAVGNVRGFLSGRVENGVC